MLNKAFLQYSSSQATDCFSKKKKKKAKETRFYAKLRPCSPVCKISTGKQPDTLLSADEISLRHRGEKTVDCEKCK